MFLPRKFPDSMDNYSLFPVFVVILVPLFSGYVLKKVLGYDRILPGARFLLQINLIFFEPAVIIWFLGKLPFRMETLFLPFAGTVLVFLGFFYGLLVFSGYSSRNRLTLVVTSSLANHGYTMGGAVSFFLLGDTGLGKALLFVSYFYFYLYGFLFPWIQHHSRTEIREKEKNWKYFLHYRNVPFLGLVAGTVIFLFQIPLPSSEILDSGIRFLMFVSIVVYYFQLGVELQFRKIRIYKKEIILVIILKFVLVPLTAYLLLKFLTPGFSGFEKKLIFLMSFMPSAVYSIVSAILFRLNVALASSLFISTTIVFFLLLPFIRWLLSFDLF